MNIMTELCKCGDVVLAESKKKCDWCWFKQNLSSAQRTAQQGDLPFGNFNAMLKAIIRMYWEDQQRCKYCDVVFFSDIKGSSPSIDKIVPTYGYVKYNLQLICLSCNSKKGGFSIAENFYLRVIDEQLAVQRALQKTPSIGTFELMG